MATQETTDEDTKILREFVELTDAERTNGLIEVENGGDAHVSEDDTTVVCDSDFTKIGGFSRGKFDTDVSGYSRVYGAVERGDTYTIESGTTYLHDVVKPILTAFDTDADTFFNNSKTIGLFEHSLLLFDDPDSGLCAVVAPYVEE